MGFAPIAAAGGASLVSLNLPQDGMERRLARFRTAKEKPPGGIARGFPLPRSVLLAYFPPSAALRRLPSPRCFAPMAFSSPRCFSQ